VELLQRLHGEPQIQPTQLHHGKARPTSQYHSEISQLRNRIATIEDNNLTGVAGYSAPD
jgi:hypothetical protein